MSELSHSYSQIGASLRRMTQLPEERVNLAEAALLVASSEYPDLDPTKYLSRLDEMASKVGERLGPETDPLKIIDGINQFLFVEEGFFGNAGDYYDPRNSFLNDVLDRRTGIPITLSTVYLEMAHRLKLPLVGVGMPGHFLVKHPYFDILIDPYEKGQILTESECRDKMKELLGENVPFHPAYLQGVTKQHIVTRMLNNLRGIYANASQFHKALGIAEMAVALVPGSLPELKHRAALYIKLQRFRDAQADLIYCLENEPDAEDAEELRQILAELKRSQAQLN